MSRIILIIAAVFPASMVQAATLEIPTPNMTHSGIGVISGWKCTAGNLTVRFDGGPALPLLHGSERADTQGVCGDKNNGFVSIMNWGKLGDGQHTAVAYDNGVEFDRATFWVVTTGENFLRDAHGTCRIADFPSPGETATFTWTESTQHLELTELETTDGGPGGLTDKNSATVFDSPNSSQAGSAWWTVWRDDCEDHEDDEILMTLIPLTAQGFKFLASQISFTQNGYQFDSDHFYVAELDSTNLRWGEHYQQGDMAIIIIEALDGSPLNFAQPFVMSYYGKEILTPSCGPHPEIVYDSPRGDELVCRFEADGPTNSTSFAVSDDSSCSGTCAGSLAQFGGLSEEECTSWCEEHWDFLPDDTSCSEACAGSLAQLLGVSGEECTSACEKSCPWMRPA